MSLKPTSTGTIAREMDGLRKRLSRPPSPPVAELRMLHEEDGEDDDAELHGGREGDFSAGSSSDHREPELETRPVPEAGNPTKDQRIFSGRTRPTVLRDSSQTVPNAIPYLPRSRRQPSRTISEDKRSRERGASASSSWLGYDLSVIVALVSPIGNLLTGSDHIKNILLLLLLIYYLHQLVEVPWTLYRMSIPSYSPVSTPKDEHSTKHAAHAELRTLEVFYLILTVLSPFLGATLLKYVAAAISGSPETLSWFSTSLFVLATGVRPWSHLVERLKDRSRALNTLLEEDKEEGLHGEQYPSDTDTREVELDKELVGLRHRLEMLDTRLAELADTSAHEWNDFADAVDSAEVVHQRHHEEAAQKAKAHEARLDALEMYVLTLQHGNIRGGMKTYSRAAQLQALVWEIVALPWTAAVILSANVQKLMSHLPFFSNRAYTKAVPSLHPSVSALEPILEEASLDPRFPDSDSDHTLVGKSTRRSNVRSDASNIDHSTSIIRRIISFVLFPVTLTLRVSIFLANLPLAAFRVAFS
ncbi:hypothetical protein M0805_004021 [Coniferiporia weirii]|nr:hypothetical protein M0805_004021 [Coniferiporia weirii]